MKLYAILFAGLFASALSACGGEGSSSTPATQAASAPVVAPANPANLPASTTAAASSPAASDPAVAPPAASDPVVTPPAPKQILIEVYGDDAMLGMTSMMTVTQQSEPAYTQAILQAQFPGVTVANHAAGGTSSTLVNEMNGVDGNGAPFAQRILLSKADIVLDNHAINDDAYQSLAPYSDALVAWIAAVKAAGKIPVLEEPNPVCDGNHPYLENYVSVMDNVAAQYNVPVVLQYQQILALPNWCSHFNDGFYPDAYIQSLKAQNQAATLAPLVKSLVGNGF